MCVFLSYSSKLVKLNQTLLQLLFSLHAANIAWPINMQMDDKFIKPFNWWAGLASY